MSLLIKGGTIVTAADTYVADVYVEGEKVKMIGTNLDAGDGVDVLNADGKYVFPGFIDAHTHFEIPFGGTVSSDDFYSGTVGAAYGGTTCIVDFAIQTKGQALKEALEARKEKADSKAVVDYSFHMAVTDANDAVLKEMPEIISEGVSSFKCFMAYKGLMLDDGSLYKVLRAANEHGALVGVHAENGDIIDNLTKDLGAQGKIEPFYHAVSRPPMCEDEATNRVLLLAKATKAPIYIFHLSSVGALKAAIAARQSGQQVFVETCPHYLYFDIHALEKPDFEGAKFVMSPPLRPSGYQEKLWRTLVNGGIDVVATDHCVFKFKGQKDMGKDDFARIPNGVPGVEERALLIYQGGVVERKMSLNRFVDLLSTMPARIFGLYPEKGTIMVGSDADIVVFDPHAKDILRMENLHFNSDYSAYEGREISGRVEHVFLRGKPVITSCNFVGRAGRGRFLERKRFSV